MDWLRLRFYENRNLLLAILHFVVYLGLLLICTIAVGNNVVGTVVGSILAFIFMITYYLDCQKKVYRKLTLKQVPLLGLFALTFLIWISAQSMAAWLTDIGVVVPPSPQPSADLWLYVILALVIAPVVEELLFRGIVYSHLRAQWGLGPAVIISALLFALMHGNLFQAIPSFLSGLFFATVYERSQRLYFVSLIHAFMNLLSVLLSGLEISAWVKHPAVTFSLWLLSAGALIHLLYKSPQGIDRIEALSEDKIETVD